MVCFWGLGEFLVFLGGVADAVLCTLFWTCTPVEMSFEGCDICFFFARCSLNVRSNFAHCSLVLRYPVAIHSIPIRFFFVLVRSFSDDVYDPA